ncbi:MAG: hypothetical protein LBI05_02860 [Planctomycetaceae bacterium]|jgi:hypothetical protein|nr:hypothetical protein [Planctomycetaceae bacterium]
MEKEADFPGGRNPYNGFAPTPTLIKYDVPLTIDTTTLFVYKQAYGSWFFRVF